LFASRVILVEKFDSLLVEEVIFLLDLEVDGVAGMGLRVWVRDLQVGEFIFVGCFEKVRHFVGTCRNNINFIKRQWD
jgi:hypothetical protein